MFLYNNIFDKLAQKIGKILGNELDKRNSDLKRDVERLFKNELNKVNARNSKSLEILKADLFNALSKTIPRNVIQHLDYHLVTHCNLNCKGCSTFAPIAKEWFANPNTFQKEIDALHRLTGDNVVYIHLLGGEPLLHPQVEAFAMIARDAFPKARIDFTTNGILIRQMPESFWSVLRRAEIAIKFTRYPIALDYDALIRYIKSKNIEVFSAGGEKPIAYFRRIPMNPKGTFNMFRSYLQCPYTDCAQLRDGKLFHCPASAFHDILNEHIIHTENSEKYTFKLHRRDFIDLRENEPTENIGNFLSGAIPFCSYCDMAHMDAAVPWDQSERRLEEWVEL